MFVITIKFKLKSSLKKKKKKRRSHFDFHKKKKIINKKKGHFDLFSRQFNFVDLRQSVKS